MSSESHQSQHREELGHLSCSFLHEYVYICAYLMPTEKLSVFISKWLIMLLYNRGHRKNAAGTNLSGMVVRWRFAGVFCRDRTAYSSGFSCFPAPASHFRRVNELSLQPKTSQMLKNKCVPSKQGFKDTAITVLSSVLCTQKQQSFTHRG